MNDTIFKYMKIPTGGYTVWLCWGPDGRSGFMLGHIYSVGSWRATVDDGRKHNDLNGTMKSGFRTRATAAEWLRATLLHKNSSVDLKPNS